MSSLFPDAADGFEPKAPEGVLARYCARCGAHLDAHGTAWRTAEGSLRTCPPPQYDAAAAPPAPDAAVPSDGTVDSPSGQPAYMANPPFGTDFNARAGPVTGSHGTGRRHVLPPEPSPSGSGAAVVGDATRMTRAPNKQFLGSLKGSACDPAGTTIDLDQRRAVPARKSNTSQLSGAGLLSSN
eukprot:CAMPEP_0174879430 /NCGR_PEP_ID=MMETSP1114-20130205/83257_1 /TAXON_ID=312471 /ORGANISM="Neobodo designis, Strain CCAP 1951/1" /LENGTH=182 /DNA_ID=CAMNT_0016114823 /DNA_START=47 /DNA_END=595 /DNA_ORIENTATION=+